MLCPRCCEELENQATECPVCHKRLSLSGRANTRVSLTGDAYPLEDAPIAPSAPAPPQEPDTEQEEPPAVQPIPIHLIPTNPDRFPVRRRVAPPPVRRDAAETLRFLIVGLALAGAIASAILWRWPYVAPVVSHVQPGAQDQLVLTADAERPIPMVYLCLWGFYGLLAVATQLLFPAPWRFGRFNLRTNWVLTVTTVATLILFASTDSIQRDRDEVQPETLVQQDGGTFEYRNGETVRSVSAEEARTLVGRMIQIQEAGIYRIWNMAALLSFLALGGYAAWWIVVRPEWEGSGPPTDIATLIRLARGEPESEAIDSAIVAAPGESARSREPATGDITWR